MEQKFSFKKLLSVFLVCAMLLSSFTFLAFAEEATNVALGSKYEIVGLAPSGSYPDADNKELTDGARVEGKYNDSGWVGVILTGSVRSFDVVVTLGDGETVYDIDKIVVNAGAAGCTCGVTEPELKTFYSVDGEEWLEFGSYTATGTDATNVNATMTVDAPVAAKYIKVNVGKASGAGNLMWLGEIEAYGEEAEEEPAAKDKFTIVLGDGVKVLNSDVDSAIALLTDGNFALDAGAWGNNTSGVVAIQNPNPANVNSKTAADLIWEFGETPEAYNTIRFGIYSDANVMIGYPTEDDVYFSDDGVNWISGYSKLGYGETLLDTFATFEENATAPGAIIGEIRLENPQTYRFVKISLQFPKSPFTVDNGYTSETAKPRWEFIGLTEAFEFDYVEPSSVITDFNVDEYWESRYGRGAGSFAFTTAEEYKVAWDNFITSSYTQVAFAPVAGVENTYEVVVIGNSELTFPEGGFIWTAYNSAEAGSAAEAAINLFKSMTVGDQYTFTGIDFEKGFGEKDAKVEKYVAPVEDEPFWSEGEYTIDETGNWNPYFAWGYEFAIDSVNSTSGACTAIFDNATDYAAKGPGKWTTQLVLAPVAGEEGVYELIKAYKTTGKNAQGNLDAGNIDFEGGKIVLSVQDSGTRPEKNDDGTLKFPNWEDRAASWGLINTLRARLTLNGNTLTVQDKPADPVISVWGSGATVDVMTDGYTGLGEITGYEGNNAKLYGFSNDVLFKAEYSFDVTVGYSAFDAITLYTLDYAGGGVMLPEAVKFVVNGTSYDAVITANENGIATIKAELGETVKASTVTVKVTMGASPYSFPIFNMFTELEVNKVEVTTSNVVTDFNPTSYKQSIGGANGAFIYDDADIYAACGNDWWIHVAFAPVADMDGYYEVVAVRAPTTGNYLAMPENGFIWMAWSSAGDTPDSAGAYALAFMNDLEIGDIVKFVGVDFANHTTEADAYAEVWVDPNAPVNVALGKDYEISGIGNRDSYYGNVTDGIAVMNLGSNKSAEWFGFYHNGNYPTNAPDKVGYFIIDLEKVYDVESIRVGLIKNDSWGIGAPASVKAYGSLDGETFEEIGTFEFSLVDGVGVWTEIATEAQAQYIKIEVTLGGTFAFVNEVEVYGKEVEEESTVGTKEDPAVIEILPGMRGYMGEGYATLKGGDEYYFTAIVPVDGNVNANFYVIDAEYNGYNVLYSLNGGELLDNYNFDNPGLDNLKAGDVITVYVKVADEAPEVELTAMISLDAVGSMSNPAEVEAGDIETVIAEGNYQGYTYEYVASADGIVTITMSDDNTGWLYSVSNVEAGIYGDMHYSDDDPIVASESVEVKAGDVITISISTYGGMSSAGTVKWTLAFEEPKPTTSKVVNAFNVGHYSEGSEGANGAYIFTDAEKYGDGSGYAWWRQVALAPVEGEEGLYKAVAITEGGGGTSGGHTIPEGGFIWVAFEWPEGAETSGTYALGVMNTLSVGSYVEFTGIDIENCTTTADATAVKSDYVDPDAPVNVALDKKYEISGIGNRDSYYGSITDGSAVMNLNGDNHKNWFGFYHNGDNPTNAPDKVGYFIIDLEKVYDIDTIKVGLIQNVGWGIAGPAGVKAYGSLDGETFEEIGTFEFSLVDGVGVWTEIAAEAKAQYIKIEVTLAGTFAFVNEVEVYGEEAEIVDPNGGKLSIELSDNDKLIGDLDTAIDLLTDGDFALNAEAWGGNTNGVVLFQNLNATDSSAYGQINLIWEFNDTPDAYNHIKLGLYSSVESMIGYPSEEDIFFSNDGVNWVGGYSNADIGYGETIPDAMTTFDGDPTKPGTVIAELKIRNPQNYKFVKVELYFPKSPFTVDNGYTAETAKPRWEFFGVTEFEISYVEPSSVITDFNITEYWESRFGRGKGSFAFTTADAYTVAWDNFITTGYTLVSFAPVEGFENVYEVVSNGAASGDVAFPEGGFIWVAYNSADAGSYGKAALDLFATMTVGDTYEFTGFDFAGEFVQADATVEKWTAPEEPKPVISVWGSGGTIDVLTDGYTGVGEVTKWEGNEAKLYGLSNNLLVKAEYDFTVAITESKFDAITLYALDYAGGGVMLPESVKFVVGDETFDAVITANENGIATIKAELGKEVTASEIKVLVVMGESPYTFGIFNMFTELTVDEVEVKPEVLLGDVNGNGEIEMYDYILVKRQIMNTIELTEEQMAVADVNGNGEIEMYDYILIKRHIMGTFVIGE